MSKKISLGDIESRLGKQARVSTPSAYDDYDSPTPARQQTSYNTDDDDDDGSTLSAGFIATCVAAFLAVGGGTFFFMGGEFNMKSLMTWEGNDITTDYVSAVDSQCRKGWVAEQFNYDQLHCFLTRNAVRLCKPEERKHLVMTIDQFWTDASVIQGKMAKATMQTIGRAQTDGLRLGLEAAKLENMQGKSEEEQAEQFSKVMDISGNMMKESDDIMRSMKRNEKTGSDVENAFRKLVQAGYIKESDFGWYQPKFVKNVFKQVDEGLAVKANNCRT